MLMCFSTAILLYNIVWCSLSTRWLIMTFCILHWRTIVKLSLGGVLAFPVGPFQASVSPFCLSEGPCLAPRLLFFLITYPRIEVTSRLFWSNSVGLRDNFPVGIAVKTLLFGRIFAKFEDLGVVHVGDQVLRFFAELVDLLRLSRVLNE